MAGLRVSIPQRAAAVQGRRSRLLPGDSVGVASSRSAFGKPPAIPSASGRVIVACSPARPRLWGVGLSRAAAKGPLPFSLGRRGSGALWSTGEKVCSPHGASICIGWEAELDAPRGRSRDREGVGKSNPFSARKWDSPPWRRAGKPVRGHQPRSTPPLPHGRGSFHAARPAPPPAVALGAASTSPRNRHDPGYDGPSGQPTACPLLDRWARFSNAERPVPAEAETGRLVSFEVVLPSPNGESTCLRPSVADGATRSIRRGHP
jgi:hypothetical protein